MAEPGADTDEVTRPCPLAGSPAPSSTWMTMEESE
jgi:hypothetical protein